MYLFFLFPSTIFNSFVAPPDKIAIINEWYFFCLLSKVSLITEQGCITPLHKTLNLVGFMRQISIRLGSHKDNGLESSKRKEKNK